jgi:hypothetical protein
MKKLFLYTVLFLNLISCKNEIGNDFNEDILYNQLEIRIDDNLIRIDKESRIGTLQIIDSTNKSTISDSFKLTKFETNKIFSNSYNFINSKNQIIKTLSCYAGQNFKIKLNRPNEFIEFKNESIASWSKTSKETEQIYFILKNKIKIAE